MAAFYNDTIFVRCNESGTQSPVKLISSNFLRTIDDMFFRLLFASVKDMNKALADARVTEKDMATFTGRLRTRIMTLTKMFELTFNQVWRSWHYACIIAVECCLFV